MPETRLTELPILSFDPRVGISWSASETTNWLFSLHIIAKIEVFNNILYYFLYIFTTDVFRSVSRRHVNLYRRPMIKYFPYLLLQKSYFYNNFSIVAVIVLQLMFYEG